MLGKLIKYDLMADYKKYAAVCISMLASSVMMLFFDKMTSWISNNTFITVMSAVFTMVFFGVCLAAGIMLLVLSTIRFYKNVVRDEGYLTHTLPVPTWQIIASKLITVYIWFFVTVIAACICSGIAFGEPFWLFEFSDALADNEELKAGFEFGFNIGVNGAPVADTEAAFGLFTKTLSIYAAFLLLSPLTAMSCIYFSFALGNLFNRSKLGMSVLMYFALNIGQAVIGGVCSVFMTPKFIAEAAKYEEELPLSIVFDYLSSSLTAALILSVVLSIGFMIGTERIFAKKLNLE